MTRSALILLVEDDHSMLNGMRDLLQTPDLLQTVGIEFGFEVMTASNGQEALEKMADHTPDLIVSDIMMPIMDGFQFLNRVQANPDWLHIPFIFLTAKGDKKEIIEGQIRGANLYITKPFISTELLELIKSQLDRSFQRQVSHQQHVADLKKGILQILNHEFRTPLTYVTAYYEMLADSLQHFPDHQNFQEYLRGIQAGCVRLTKLVEDFIFVIELRTGEFQSKYRQRASPITTINTLVQKTLQAQEDKARQKNIRLHFTPAENLPPLFGDEESLLTVFSRLLSNAIKFTPVGADTEKNITISTYVQENNIHIAFQDEGPGFPPHIEKQIFDLFFQYNRGRMEQQGAGTGLTIAKGLVELHRGHIQVESQEDVGSAFTVVLPIHTGPIEKPALTVNGPQGKKDVTILVVEDEYNLLLGLKELIEIFDGKYRLNVLTALNGQLGLQVLKERQPDLIISDIMMPIMDGHEFLRNVRLNPDWIQIPFIFLTAKGERKDVHEGLRSGAESYIAKPYDSDELLQLIVAQLDHYFQLQGVMTQNFDALKRSILSLITPDFRLPLETVHAYSETLAASMTDARNDTELKESLHGIRDGSIRLTQLVEDFISLAELKTGETETAYALREQPIYNPGLLVCEASQMCAPMAKAMDIQLHCDANADLSPIYGDSKTLLEALRRLLEVCLKLCNGCSNQIISLTATQDADETLFSITLPVMALNDDLAKMRAVLAENELNLSDLPDFAPSLSIARNYIELNNGRIQIQPEEPNANYCIRISLPIYTPIETTPTNA